MLKRGISKFSLKGNGKNPIKPSSPTPTSKSIHPTEAARTRFAPSPTGFLHLGSLRTALYNYLLARNTGGQFLLRLEDTDQSRLVKGAEHNIYDTLKWCGIHIDEGPNVGGKFGPYRQSERIEIYNAYAKLLVDKGLAYYCYCSKDRLNNLRQSALQLKPPTTVTYDRKCLNNGTHGSLEKLEQADQQTQPVIRFKSPEVYDPITDLIHGELNLQPQYNRDDRRYDDIVIIKSDGLPTYHFANVVDDHLMGITHVIRGEEWLSATPKHVAMYKAFGWTPPKFIHIPLLTSLSDKKLSKRDGKSGIISLADKVLPEALVNFVALFGWSPPRLVPGEPVSEVMNMNELIEKFSLNNLTKGNAKVNDSKLYYFNKHHFQKILDNEERLEQLARNFNYLSNDISYIVKILKSLGPNFSALDDINQHGYLFHEFEYDLSKVPSKETKSILTKFCEFDYDLQEFVALNSFKKKDIFQSIRFALSNGTPGLSIPSLIELIGPEKVEVRIKNCINIL